MLSEVYAFRVTSLQQGFCTLVHSLNRAIGFCVCVLTRNLGELFVSAFSSVFFFFFFFFPWAPAII